VRRTILSLAALGAVVGLLVGCRPEPLPTPSDSPTGALPSPGQPDRDGGVIPEGEPTTLWTGLDAPWSVVRGDGIVLVSERDSGRVLVLLTRGGVREAGRVPGVAHGGEGGLLGLALLEPEGPGPRWLYAFHTAEDGNRIVRMPLVDGRDGVVLGETEPLLAGIPRAGNHNGGRIAFGPDGMLYATAGDAGSPDRAQDRDSLAGKILRMTPEGGVPADNPFPGSLVYSVGHRNPQGLAWDDAGRLWSSEFGQNRWDELNLIAAGGNYGWPVVEGEARDGRYIDPVAQWSTDEASPSGLAWVSGTLFLAALRGERLWAVQVDAETGRAETAAFYTGEHGRIRDVVPGPDGTLWFVTSNTDGRGDPGADDDRLLSVGLAPR